MRKSKVLKALLVFGMSIATATSVVGMTACNNEHEHTYGDWQSDKDGHWKVATCHTDEKTEKEDHVDSNNDNKCDVCGYTLQTSGGNEGGDNEGGDNEGGDNEGGDNEGGDNEGGDNEGGDNEGGDNEGENPPAPVVKEPVVVDFTKGTLAKDTAIIDGLGITACQDLTIDESNRSGIYKGETVNFTTRLRFGAAVSTSNSLKVLLDEDATILAYGSAISTGSSDGYLTMLDSEGKKIGSQFVSQAGSSVSIPAVFSVKANTTYYLGTTQENSATQRAAISRIVVIYGEFTEDKGELTPAVDETCTTPGNIAYYKTEYGRYLNESEAVVGPNEVFKGATGHTYTLKAGSVITPSNDPENNPGKATLTCANGHETEVDLPILSSDKYTARPTEGETGTYTIKVEDVEISFEAVGVGQQDTTYTTVYQPDFTNLTVGNDATFADDEVGKVYAVGTATGTVEGGVLKVNATDNTGSVFVALKDEISTGVVKITGEMKCASANGSWTYFQVVNKAGTEFAALRTVKSGNEMSQKVRIDGSEVGDAKGFSINETFTFEILIDLDNKKVTIKVDDTVMVNEMSTTKGTDFYALKLFPNGDRNIHLHSVNIATQD